MRYARLIDRTYQETRQLLESHREELGRLAEALLRHETLTHDEVDRVLKGELLVKSTVSDLINAEKDKSDHKKSPPAQPDNPPLDGGGALPSPA